MTTEGAPDRTVPVKTRIAVTLQRVVLDAFRQRQRRPGGGAKDAIRQRLLALLQYFHLRLDRARGDQSVHEHRLVRANGGQDTKVL
jgi:hypothetical protein